MASGWRDHRPGLALSAAAFGVWAYALGVVVFDLAGANLPLIFLVFNNGFTLPQQAYGRLISRLIDGRRMVMVALISGIVVIISAFMALPQAFIPNEDQGYLAGIYQLQNGAPSTRPKRWPQRSPRS